MERELDTRDSVRVVTANNFLKASNLENISLKARKLLYLAIAQCRQDDKEFYTYKVTATEFADLMGIQVSHVYQEADTLTDELMAGFRKFKLFDTCEYEKGVLTIQLDKDMTPILLNLKRDFTQPLLSDFMKMRSGYSMTIWHLMQREMQSHKTGVTDIVTFSLTLEELRSATGTTDKFERLSQFKAKVLDKAIEIQSNCGVIVEYKNVKTGRFVTGFKFTAKSLYYIDRSEIPERVIQHAEAGKRRIAAEQQKRGITPTLTPEPEELPLTEPQSHSRPLTQMEKEAYTKPKQAEQLNIFSFLEKQ